MRLTLRVGRIFFEPRPLLWYLQTLMEVKLPTYSLEELKRRHAEATKKLASLRGRL